MTLESLVQQYDRVYLDNNKIRYARDCGLDTHAQSCLVIPDVIRGEFLAQGSWVSKEEARWLKQQGNVSLYSLYRESGFSQEYYEVADQVFKGVASDMLSTELKKEYFQQALDVKSRLNKEFFSQRLLRGIAQSIVGGFLGTMAYGPLASSTYTAPAEQRREMDEFRESWNPEALLDCCSDKKKRKRLEKNGGVHAKRIRDNMLWIDRQGGVAANPIQGDNYSDSMLLTYSVLDCAINGRDIAIYTMDGDLDGLARTASDMFPEKRGEGGGRLHVCYHNHYTGDQHSYKLEVPSYGPQLKGAVQDYLDSLQLEKRTARAFEHVHINKPAFDVYSDALIGLVEAVSLAGVSYCGVGIADAAYGLAQQLSPMHEVCSYAFSEHPLASSYMASFAATVPAFLYFTGKDLLNRAGRIKTLLTE